MQEKLENKLFQNKRRKLFEFNNFLNNFCFKYIECCKSAENVIIAITLIGSNCQACKAS